MILEDCFIGGVNGILLIPVLISFGTIIFKDPLFTDEDMPTLVKLVLFSGCVHQLVFTISSSLPFAVGSVQDAGLIFLSAMASSIAASVHGDKEGMLATVCIFLSLSTAMLGVGLVVIAKMKVASLIQLLPMPVVGAYLAYIGFFCGMAGLSFMTGEEICSIRDLSGLLSPHAAILAVPGVLAGVGVYLSLRSFHSAATLPVCLLTILLVFFGGLLVGGYSLEDAREFGWISPKTPSISLTASWSHFQPSLVHWSAFEYIFIDWLAMFFVVAFSSSLDVAAIEMEKGEPLDYNTELMTVGLSNIASGLFGGFTGSYIFSQTIFNLRAGVTSRSAGFTTTAMLAVVAALPFNVMSYMPKIFFGCLLILISTDLMVEWLWLCRAKMTPTEFAVLLTTFVAIHLTNVQVGMGLGVISAACIFALNYAMLPALVLPRHPHSSVMRNFEERRILAVHLDEVAVLSLRGYIFFGSAIKLVQEVEKHIFWEGGNCEEHGGEIETEEQHLLDRRLSASPTKSPGGLRARLSNTQMNFTPIFNRGGSLSFVGEEDAAGGGASPSFLSGASRGAHRNVVYDGEMGAEVKEKMNVYMEIWADSPMDRARQPSQTGSCFGTQAKQTKYIALDFEHVVGVDCTAARVSFLMLRTLCRQAGVQLVFAGVRHKGILQILEANGVLTSTDRAFDDVDAALEWCEEEILSTVALAPVKSPSPRSLQSILGDYLELREYNFDNSMRSTLDAAVHFFELERHSAEGTVIFSEEEAATKLYFISHGEVELERPGRKRLAKLRAGATFGELGFFLKSSQSFRAVTTSKECILYTLSRRAMASMQRENPVLLTVLQKAILKSMCLADSTAISHAI